MLLNYYNLSYSSSFFIFSQKLSQIQIPLRYSVDNNCSVTLFEVTSFAVTLLSYLLSGLRLIERYITNMVTNHP